jgi:hypothetical protein
MKIYAPNQFRRSHLPLLLLITALVLPALACNLGEPEPLWTPETTRQYTAETTPV